MTLVSINKNNATLTGALKNSASLSSVIKTFQNALLIEIGDYLLQENGGKLLLEQDATTVSLTNINKS